MSKQCIPSDGKDIGCKNVVLKTSKQALPFLKVGNIGWNSSLDQSTIKFLATYMKRPRMWSPSGKTGRTKYRSEANSFLLVTLLKIEIVNRYTDITVSDLTANVIPAVDRNHLLLLFKNLMLSVSLYKGLGFGP